MPTSATTGTSLSERIRVGAWEVHRAARCDGSCTRLRAFRDSGSARRWLGQWSGRPELARLLSLGDARSRAGSPDDVVEALAAYLLSGAWHVTVPPRPQASGLSSGEGNSTVAGAGDAAESDSSAAAAQEAPAQTAAAAQTAPAEAAEASSTPSSSVEEGAANAAAAEAAPAENQVAMAQTLVAAAAAGTAFCEVCAAAEEPAVTSANPDEDPANADQAATAATLRAAAAAGTPFCEECARA